MHKRNGFTSGFAQFALPACLLTALFIGVLYCPSLAQQELRDWDEFRLLDCIFCMDYDNYKKMSVFGCGVNRTPTCRGNVCYMRQHKPSSYFLYTSGCLNLTRQQAEQIQKETANAYSAVERGATGIETQLCEVTVSINTCLCANRALCNNLSSIEPFTEISGKLIMGATNFNEVAHFKYFLPNDPVPQAMEHTERDEYFLIKGVNNGGTVVGTISSLVLSVCMFFWLLSVAVLTMCNCL